MQMKYLTLRGKIEEIIFLVLLGTFPFETFSRQFGVNSDFHLFSWLTLVMSARSGIILNTREQWPRLASDPDLGVRLSSLPAVNYKLFVGLRTIKHGSRIDEVFVIIFQVIVLSCVSVSSFFRNTFVGIFFFLMRVRYWVSTDYLVIIWLVLRMQNYETDSLFFLQK